MKKPLTKILIIEDDEDDFILLEDMISTIHSAEFQSDWVRSFDEAVEAISKGGYDLCFLDYRLGPQTGLDLLNHAVSINFAAPIVFLTGQGDYNVDLKAMEAGAADYLVKGEFNASVLERVIRYSLARRDFQQKLRTAYEELERRVEERTFQLAEANIELQNEVDNRFAAEKALQESESVMHAVINDVDNCLDAILDNISTAQEGLKKNHKIYHLLEAAGKSAEQARDLTRRFITMNEENKTIKDEKSVGHERG